MWEYQVRRDEGSCRMGLNLYVVLGSAVVGLLVGLTGAGGGALMTPMLILLFGVKPAAAISSDLVAAVVMRPVGAAVHLHKGTVNLRLVGLDVARLGADGVPRRVPAARDGRQLRRPAERRDRAGRGAAGRRGRHGAPVRPGPPVGPGAHREDRRGAVRPVPTVLIGMAGGLIVGITSVGSGSLMIILLLFTYPLLSAGQLVGTDLTQAVPLTAAAALGALAFGHVEFGVTASIIVGSVPAVLVGSLLSSRAPDRYIRPAITFVIFASGLKYVGVPPTRWAAPWAASWWPARRTGWPARGPADGGAAAGSRRRRAAGPAAQAPPGSAGAGATRPSGRRAGQVTVRRRTSGSGRRRSAARR